MAPAYVTTYGSHRDSMVTVVAFISFFYDVYDVKPKVEEDYFNDFICTLPCSSFRTRLFWFKASMGLTKIPKEKPNLPVRNGICKAFGSRLFCCPFSFLVLELLPRASTQALSFRPFFGLYAFFFLL